MRSSSAMTMLASSTSCWSSASSVRSSVATTRSSAPRHWPSSALSSSWKCSRAVATTLSELSGHVALRALVARVGEDLVGRHDLHELAVEHERGGIRHSRGLLHVVGHDDDRHPRLELLHELLDLQ